MNNNIIDHPSYYNSSCFEVIDFIELFNLNFCLGNAVKYISRAGKKTHDVIQDLEKAKWYLEREKNYYMITTLERKKVHFKEFPIEHALKITELFCKGQNFVEKYEHELTETIFYIIRALFDTLDDKIDNYCYAIEQLDKAINICSQRTSFIDE